MSAGLFTIIYPVKDIERAKTLFGALTGTAPAFESPYYVQFNIGEQRLGLDPNGHARGFSGSVGYWQVEDINARLEELLAAGATLHEAVKDVGNGARIASVTDAEGNVIGLIQPS